MRVETQQKKKYVERLMMHYDLVNRPARVTQVAKLASGYHKNPVGLGLSITY